MSPLRKWSTVLLVVFVAFIVNFPLAHGTYLDWQLDRRGVDVVAEVTDTRAAADGFLVQFTVPADGSREEFEGALAEVDQVTFDEARQTGTMTVTVLPDNGAVFEAEGEVHSRLGVVVTLLADLFLLAVVVLAWRFRTALRVELVLRATEDLERCPPGARLDRLEGLRYLVAGDVAEIGDDEIVLDLGDRRVRVLLDGHANPAGYQQPVSVVGHMVA
jgi:hypothetical protein